MPLCKKCGKTFPNRLKINEKVHVLSNRKYCLDCSPFNYHNTKQLHISTKINIDDKKKKASKAIIKRRQDLSKKAVEYKGGKCQICGYNKCFRALEFHHIDPKGKLFGVKSGNTYSWEKVRAEADKCVLLCANCHREVEDGITSLDLALDF